MREAAAERLLLEKEELARAITGRLYEAMPELMEKHGERGRSKCLQDMRYNIEHLAPAVALGEISLFSRYCEWLREMLASRGVAGEEVVLSLRLTAVIVGERFPPEEAGPVIESVEAGLAALTPGGA